MTALLLAVVVNLHTPTLTCRVSDASGHVQRSEARRRFFMKATGYPKGRPGYVVDHVVPLCYGGCDLASNMQWQTVETARVKDRWEVALCSGKTALTWDEWREAR